MKIYTKTGDKGKTSLFGGTRVPKYHLRIEAYGTIDELNAYIGLLRDQKIDKHTSEVLFKIQNELFKLLKNKTTNNKYFQKFIFIILAFSTHSKIFT